MPRLKINRQGVVRLREQIRPHRMKSVIAIPQKRNISLSRVKNGQPRLKAFSRGQKMARLTPYALQKWKRL